MSWIGEIRTDKQCGGSSSGSNQPRGGPDLTHVWGGLIRIGQKFVLSLLLLLISKHRFAVAEVYGHLG
nr:hypothetical protein [Kocuria sp. 36]